jgi:hypothetical protein
MGGALARMGEMRRGYSILYGKSEGKRPLGRPSVDGKIVLQWIIGEKGGRLCMSLSRRTLLHGVASVWCYINENTREER